MSKSVLLLNASFEPMCTISLRRATALMLAEKVEIISAREGESVRSARQALPAPSVLRLIKYVNVPRTRKANLTRKAVLNRDGYVCAYCGEKKSLRDMTMDHIVPRSKGGLNTWKNVVACCFPCNQRKGNISLEELGWQLRFQPFKPDGTRRVAIIAGHIDPDWEQWLNPDSPA